MRPVEFVAVTAQESAVGTRFVAAISRFSASGRGCVPDTTRKWNGVPDFT
jgi:hypothetical protein